MLQSFHTRLCHRTIIKNIQLFQVHTDKLERTPKEATEPECNFIKLIGTVASSPIKLSQGDLSFKVNQSRTVGKKFFSYNHRVNMSLKVQNTIKNLDLSEGKRIDINGKIKSSQFIASDGKTRQSMYIKPDELNPCETSDPDTCIVMMTAFIDSTISNRDTFSIFNLVTHTPISNENHEFTGETSKAWHSVLVTDPILCQFVRNELSKYDQVFVQGYLSYKNATDKEGKHRIYGSIIAEKIETTS